MKKGVIGIAAFIVTLAVMIPILFVLSRGSVSTNQYFIIVAAVLLLVLWTIPFVTLVDPLLRRGVGSLFNVTIDWRGTSQSISWTPNENTGCLLNIFLALLGYLFIILWLAPFAAAMVLVWWLRR